MPSDVKVKALNNTTSDDNMCLFLNRPQQKA